MEQVGPVRAGCAKASRGERVLGIALLCILGAAQLGWLVLLTWAAMRFLTLTL